MSTRTHFEVAGVSDTGRVRDCNEDRIGWDSDLGLAVLADGMGGHNAGEVASQIAVDTVLAEFRRAVSETPFAPLQDDDGTEAVYLCMNAVAQANAEIHQASVTDLRYAGMGTTVAVVLCGDHGVTIAHVGDSRVYRWRRDVLEQLTADHSMQQELVRNGLATADEAQRVVGKNVITRALGVGPEVDIDAMQEELQGGDIFLLCSDGLSDFISPEDMAVVLRASAANLEESARELVNRANARGGYDNVSVILVRCGAPQPKV